MPLLIREMQAEDWDAVQRIYSEGFKSNSMLLQSEVLDWYNWDHTYLSKCRYVAFYQQELVGWLALTPYSLRREYFGVAETHVFVYPNTHYVKVGTALVQHLIPTSETAGIWTLQANVFTENDPAIHLYTNLEFRVVGERQQFVKYNGQWRNIVMLERRSKCVGIDC